LKELAAAECRLGARLVGKQESNLSKGFVCPAISITAFVIDAIAHFDLTLISARLILAE
jgi:hypothetical protein